LEMQLAVNMNLVGLHKLLLKKHGSKWPVYWEHMKKRLF
jgi:hypothetical protein